MAFLTVLVLIIRHFLTTNSGPVLRTCPKAFRPIKSGETLPLKMFAKGVIVNFFFMFFLFRNLFTWFGLVTLN